MDDFVELEVTLRMRVQKTDEDTQPDHRQAEKAATQAVTNAILAAEGNGFEHDLADELAITFKEIDVTNVEEFSLP